MAINLYQSCLERQPDNLEVGMYLAKAYFKKKDYESCKRLTLKLICKHP